MDLTLGLDSGVLTLGLLDAGRIEAIAEPQIPEVLLKRRGSCDHRATTTVNERF